LLEGKTGITLGTRITTRTACHAYRAIRMPTTVFVVMKTDYDDREKEYERKKKYYFLAAQY
jgi:hypothetical protein